MTAENSDCPSLKSRIGERKISSVSDFGRFMFIFLSSLVCCLRRSLCRLNIFVYVSVKRKFNKHMRLFYACVFLI